ncbi:MAG TPA: hypothetical protein VK869_07425 [Rubrobacteraceae bacterium]|nr:hypothetical protein [Rubrobacteraceae bacterium]
MDRGAPTFGLWPEEAEQPGSGTVRLSARRLAPEVAPGMREATKNNAEI